MGQKKNQITLYLQRISDILLINGGFVGSPGIYAGEMGLALFFSHYARFTGNELYKEYSFGLIKKIQNSIHLGTPIDYKQGLAGIGSAIEYLVQNCFFEGDTDDILEEFDKRIFYAYSFSLLTIDEILSIGYYALWRMSGNSSKKEYIRKSILPEIVNFMKEKYMNNNFSHPMVSFIDDIISIENIIDLPDHSNIHSFLRLCSNKKQGSFDGTSYENILGKMENTSKNIFLMNENIPLGFQNGLAGLGIFLITELDGNDSWTSLLPNDFIPEKK